MINRRSFLSLGASTALSMTSMTAGKLWALNTIPMPESGNAVEARLDAFTSDYMRLMNAPGMTQALTDPTATIRTAGYGFADVDLKIPVTTGHLFQIGSISKSFAALVLLQLHDEGKLDLHSPVIDYLPWLPITMSYGPITAHHLLTHTSGLPDGSVLFQSDPEARHAQGFAPGTHFHYCNLGFVILGQLIEKLDGKPWYQSLQIRILKPLGMKETAPVITIDSSARSAIGYQPFFDASVYPRQGKLTARPPEVFVDPAGSIAAPPEDMARYLRLLLNGGQGPKGRIVSADGFTRMATSYIKAPEFSPTSFYGYGIAVDTLDGHKILRHTGGMSAFASSIHVDLEGGYAAFASVNAMQGYRPTAVTQYAIQLLRAEKAKPLPPPEPLKDATEIENAADYAGVFRSVDGAELNFKADGKKLFLLHGSDPILLQRAQDDSFLSTMQAVFSDYNFTFGREKPPPDTAPPTSPLPVIEIGYGPAWYSNERYQGKREFLVPALYSAFIGRYRSEAGDDLRVFVRKGQLWLGETMLTPMGASLFRIGEDAWMPDTAEFLTVVEGKARLLRMVDEICWRIETGS